LESNAQGQSNLGALFPPSEAEPQEKPETDSRGDFAVQELVLRDGTVRYLARQDAEALTIDSINLTLTDFAPDSSCRFNLSGRLFGGERSRLAFEGSAGPFGAEAIPAQGTLRLEAAPAEIPPALRETYFGDLLRDAEAASHASLESSVEGDLLREIRGTGRLTFEEFQVGARPGNRLELLGEAPLEIAVERPLGGPAVSLQTPGASLQLGSGRWQGDTRFQFRQGRLEGAVKGSITGVDINQFLSAFTDASGKVFGTAQMSGLDIRFAGSGGNELMNSLAGSGGLTMENGKIVALDVFQSVVDRAQKMLTGEAPASGETEFVRFSSQWRVGGRRLSLSDILLEAGSSSLAGSGSVTFDQALDFDLRTTFRGPLAARIGGRPNAEGVAVAQVPVKVGGSVEAPRVRPDIRQIAKEKVTERVTDLLDSIFNKSKPVEKPPETQR
jgi:hypothetical protein